MKCFLVMAFSMTAQLVGEVLRLACHYASVSEFVFLFHLVPCNSGPLCDRPACRSGCHPKQGFCEVASDLFLAKLVALQFTPCQPLGGSLTGSEFRTSVAWSCAS